MTSAAPVVCCGNPDAMTSLPTPVPDQEEDDEEFEQPQEHDPSGRFVRVCSRMQWVLASAHVLSDLLHCVCELAVPYRSAF